MRHYLRDTQPIAGLTGRVPEPPAVGALVPAARGEHRPAPCQGRAWLAVSLAAVARQADEQTDTAHRAAQGAGRDTSDGVRQHSLPGAEVLDVIRDVCETLALAALRWIRAGSGSSRQTCCPSLPGPGCPEASRQAPNKQANRRDARARRRRRQGSASLRAGSRLASPTLRRPLPTRPSPTWRPMRTSPDCGGYCAPLTTAA
jgi:hypothetical protein